MLFPAFKSAILLNSSAKYKIINQSTTCRLYMTTCIVGHKDPEKYKFANGHRETVSNNIGVF